MLADFAVVGPRVSIITATYNRSGVLALAVDTVLRQSFPDWELIVIGDACTDDSPAVVEAAGDDRVRWVNLERNVGEQSGPNNAGVVLARGELIAFLNHDDLWFADHLERCTDTLERTGGELAFAFGAALSADGGVEPVAAAPAGVYAPHMSVPATTWVLRRELAERVGPWVAATECWGAPSQRWLHDAHRAGARMVQSPHLTAVVLRSGARPGSYSDGAAPSEHLEAHRRVTTDPAYRVELATAIAIEGAAWRSAPQGPAAHVRLAARDAALALALAVRQDPADWRAALRHRRRGAYLEQLRATRGLASR